MSTRSWKTIPLSCSAILCLVVAVCYLLRPDVCAAMTLWPMWVWVAPGVLLIVLGWRADRRALSLAVIVLWLVSLVTFAEEPRSLLRRAPRAVQIPGLRVVSLNCAGGSEEAAQEAAGYRPDLVLLQEAPARAQVEALANRLYGKSACVAYGVDTAIITWGKLKPIPLRANVRMHCVQARVLFESKLEIHVVSLRLKPPVLRADIWSMDCWREQTADRRTRREELQIIAQTLPKDVRLIVGGDFNAPQGDAILRLLHPRLHDTFVEGGVGWGNTVLNEIPVLRFDQVWVSQEFRTLVARIHRTVHSDHRMVVCDIAPRLNPW